MWLYNENQFSLSHPLIYDGKVTTKIIGMSPFKINTDFTFGKLGSLFLISDNEEQIPESKQLDRRMDKHTHKGQAWFFGNIINKSYIFCPPGDALHR